MIGLHQKYIEQNIDLIENDEWNEFFAHAPNGLGKVLWDAGIDFMTPIKKVPARAFVDCDISSIDIPEGVVTIEHIAFEYATNLKNISIPNSVTNIELDAFAHCENLDHVDIPNSVEYIGERAFAYCHSLRSVVLSDSLTTIKKATFFDCPALNNISVPASITTIDSSAFDYCGHINITFEGTKAKWKQLTALHKCFRETTYTCTCSDGVVKKSR